MLNGQSAEAIELRMTVEPVGRQPIGPVEEARDDLLLQEPIDLARVGVVLFGVVAIGLTVADRPPVLAAEALVPPAVEDRQRRERR